MNEKFKLLALEAKMGTADFDAGSFYVATPDRMQRFAELIVRECAEVCSGKYYYSDQMSKQCGINFAKDIKQHFGVEQ